MTLCWSETRGPNVTNELLCLGFGSIIQPKWAIHRVSWSAMLDESLIGSSYHTSESSSKNFMELFVDSHKLDHELARIQAELSLAFNCWAKCNFLNKNINWRFGLAPPLLGRASSHLMKQVDLRSTELTNAASQVTWWTKSSSTVDEWSCSIRSI